MVTIVRQPERVVRILVDPGDIKRDGSGKPITVIFPDQKRKKCRGVKVHGTLEVKYAPWENGEYHCWVEIPDELPFELIDAEDTV